MPIQDVVLYFIAIVAVAVVADRLRRAMKQRDAKQAQRAELTANEASTTASGRFQTKAALAAIRRRLADEHPDSAQNPNVGAGVGAAAGVDGTFDEDQLPDPFNPPDQETH